MTNDTDSALPTDDQLLNFHPLYDTPSPMQVVGDVRVPEPTMASLSPEMRDRVIARLADITPGNRDLFEERYIEEELLANSHDVRIMAGLGEGATPVQRELFEMANEYRLLEQEQHRLEAELTEVVRHDTRENPETGAPEPVPVHRFTGAARSARESRRSELLRQKKLLEEVEKPKRLAEACERTRALLKAQHDQITERQDAVALAEQTLREERVKQMAAGIAKMRRSNLG